MLKAGLFSLLLHLGLGVWAIGHGSPSASSPSSRAVELVTVDAAMSTSPRQAGEVSAKKESLGARPMHRSPPPPRSAAATAAETSSGDKNGTSSVARGSAAGDTQV